MQEETTFGAWLRRRRRALDLSRKAFADQVGCAEVTLRRIEAGTLKPSKELAKILLEKIGIPETERPPWISFARGLSALPLTFSSDKPATNLPASLTSFIGREKEQSDVLRLVDQHRLVTLTGAGGVGKTRLSMKAGEQVLSEYVDGVWFVELAPIRDLLLVPRVTAIAIGLRDEPQRPAIDMLSDYLREKQVLVILDNCEHLLTACAELVDTLLKRCPGLKILVTSREALGILGEAVYYVPSLPLPDTQQLLESARSYSSVRLFEERAQLARTDFSLTLENLPLVAEICGQLDGIPLAIELAAARVQILSTEQIAARLQERFRFLTSGSRTAPPRHQTLQAAIDWSYDLLSPAEQTLFRRLSVFVNGWTLEAAEAICSDMKMGPELIFDLLAQITNKSLVVAEETRAKTRYRMLETIRQYANRKLVEADESHMMRDRHLEYFWNLAEAAEPHLIRPEQIEWLFVLDADYENLRLALDWATRQDRAKPALGMCAALGCYWEIRGYWTEGAKSLATVLAMPVDDRDDTDNVARMRALQQDANLADALDNLERLKDSSELALRLANEFSDRRDVAIARLYTGLALYKLQDFDKAIPCLEETALEFQALNDPYWEAYANMWLGGTLSWPRPIDDDQSRLTGYSLRSVELARVAGERFRLARALIAYSSNLSRDNQVGEAKKHLIEARKVVEELGSISDPYDSIQIGLAEIEWLEGNRRQAQAIFRASQARLQLMGDKITSSYCLQELGLLSIEEGDLGQAQVYLEDAFSIAQDVGLEGSKANRLILLSALFYLQGDKERSKQNFRKSIPLAKNLIPAAQIDLLALLFSSPYFETSEDGVILLGALHASQKEFRRQLTPLTQRFPVRTKTHARDSLGREPFESAFAEGEKMSLDQALDLALKTVERM